ncbi:caspase family protein [Candidatus Spongiihabitans sp.]|uniref:caspase family protein n=1 Tax=Candidatus Spongiihabitans sp. TaxID=3101308 RepID=UPI003C7E4464
MIVVAMGLAALSTYRVSAGEIINVDDIARQLAPAKPESLNRSRGIGVVAAPPTDDFRKMTLPAIKFEFDSDRLTSQAVRQLTELAKALSLETLQTFFFALQGHTDSSGSESYNRDLSLRRAVAVKRHLSQEQGVAADRLVEVGLGEEFPIAGLRPADERNRRVEIMKLGLALSSSASADEGQRARTKRALLIGIDNYERVSRLNGPVNDALQMASFLSRDLQYAEHDIKLLLDATATRANILAAIDDWLIAPTAPGDEVFLFFSGHGFQQPDDNQDEADGLDETLVPVDVTILQDRSIQGMITDDDIAERLKHLVGRQVYIVIDACHSGTVTRGIGDWRYVKTPRLPDGRPLRIAGRSERTRGVGNALFQPELFLSSDTPDVTVWTAVRADQKALVDREAGHVSGSVFTRRLLWGVRDGRADSDRDGVVTKRELHDYVLAQSSTYCAQHKADCSQGLTPQFDTSAQQVESPVFGRPRTALPRAASLAKDILLSRPGRDGTPARDRVRLDLKPGAKIEVGAELNIVVDSDRDGYLVLLDIDAGGHLVQIFPNGLSLKAGLTHRIQAGRPMILPGESAEFQFRSTLPAGRGALIAVVSKENPRVQKLASRYKDLSVVPHPEAYLVELGEALRSGAAEQGEREGNEWIMGKIEYEIVSQ